MISGRDKEIYHKGGLVETVFSLMAPNLYVSPLLLMFPPKYLFSKLKQYILKLRVDYSLANYITQEEANAVYQNPEVDLSVLYAGLFKPLFTCVFFVQIQPLLSLMALVAGVLRLFVTKWHLYHTGRISKPISSQLSLTGLRIINLLPFAYGVAFLDAARMHKLRPHLAGKSQRYIHRFHHHWNRLRVVACLHADQKTGVPQNCSPKFILQKVVPVFRITEGRNIR